MGCSRPGDLPANLQGLWNEHMKAPWNADYHTNINLQMNYWPAEVANLAECHLPLFDYMKDCLVESGSRTAKVHYGCDGWVVHHLSDVWGFTTPADGVWGIWPMGGGLAGPASVRALPVHAGQGLPPRHGYPLMKGAAEFMLDFLVEAPAGTPVAGKLVTNPSHSPENQFRKADGSTSMFTYGATMDLEIIHDLFTNCIEAATILDTRRRVPRASSPRPWNDWPRCRSAPRPAGSRSGSRTTTSPSRATATCRTCSGCIPGRQITLSGTPDLAQAARKSLEYRLSHGGGHTGWSRAWIINFWARLQEAEKAHENVVKLAGEIDAAEPVRQPPALPDRRQLRRHGRHRRDAPAKPRGRDSPAARPAGRVAAGVRHRPVRPRRIRGGYLLDRRQAGQGRHPFQDRRRLPRADGDARSREPGRHAGENDRALRKDVIEFQTQAGRSYTLESRDSLNLGQSPTIDMQQMEGR